MSAPLRFYPGLHQPGDAKHFERAFVSRNRLERRNKPLDCDDVVIDSAAFTELQRYGEYRHSPEEYAALLHRLYTHGVVKITAAVAQDYMCEPFMLAKTGLTVEDHQRLTVERYDQLVSELRRLFDGDIPFHVMPVLQGYRPEEYVRHIAMYGARLSPNMWVGVGSVCKRQGDVGAIEAVLLAIAEVRPDLRLHGFRCEADRLHIANRGAASVQRGLARVELRRTQTRPQSKRLARGASFRRTRRRALPPARISAAPPMKRPAPSPISRKAPEAA